MGKWSLHTRAVSISAPLQLQMKVGKASFPSCVGFTFGSIGAAINNTKHRHDESLSDCFCCRKPLPVIRLHHIKCRQAIKTGLLRPKCPHQRCKLCAGLSQQGSRCLYWFQQAHLICRLGLRIHKNNNKNLKHLIPQPNTVVMD